MFEKIIREIENASRIIIHRHSSPDGDAIGSQIGLKYLLTHNYPEKEILVVGDGAGRYSFVEGSTMDTIPDSMYDGALAIILDTSAKHLISDSRYTLASRTARLDHHIFVEQIADAEVTDTSFESCCGFITALAKEAGWELTSQAAKALYTGMVTDSGRFRYDSTNAQTFQMAAYLMSVPFDVNDIYANLYADDFSRIKLRAQYTLKIQFTPKNVAYIYTTKEEVAESGADLFSISRGMVGTMGDIRGVNIWVNFTESETGVLCEIRSNKYNINPVAVKWGGGGHAKASGATVASREEAMAMLEDLNQLME